MLHQKYLVHQVQIQLEEEDQDIDEEYSEIEEDSEPIQIHQPQAEESQRTPHLKWKMMNQLLQEQEVKLSQLQQLQQEPVTWPIRSRSEYICRCEGRKDLK